MLDDDQKRRKVPTLHAVVVTGDKSIIDSARENIKNLVGAGSDYVPTTQGARTTGGHAGQSDSRGSKSRQIASADNDLTDLEANLRAALSAHTIELMVDQLVEKHTAALAKDIKQMLNNLR